MQTVGPIPKKVVAYAHTLIGIHEIPDGSNDGPDVHRLQASTKAYGAPWCVSTAQDIAIHTYGHTFADDTANAYYYESYARSHGWVIPRPLPGCFVAYHIGDGHFGTVADLHPNGTFDAIEGNEQNAVRLMTRDPRTLRCTFIAPPGFFVPAPPHHNVGGVDYYDFFKDVPLKHGQKVQYTEGRGYYAATTKKGKAK